METITRILLLFAVLIAGCDNGSTSAPVPGPKPKPMPIELKDVTFAELDRLVGEQKGNVVVIDVWATFCAPCLKKFPHFVELHEQYLGQGLVCISVTTDDAEDRAKALDFLKVSKAEFANYRLSESDAKIDPRLKERFSIDEQPIMFVFNRKGEKVKEFKSRNKPEEIDEYIRKLLDEK